MKFRSFALPILLVIGLNGTAAPKPDCASLYAIIDNAEKDSVRVNGIVVTGPRWYPTADVLKNLAITEGIAAQWKEKGYRVYSIGEGTGGLLPWLLDHGVDAYGVDLWYHTGQEFPKNKMGREMQEYEKKFGQRLIQGDALNLKMENDSVDRIVSNKLINNFSDRGQRTQFVEEVLRVLKPGAEARVDFLGNQTMAAELFDDLNARFPRARIFEHTEEGVVGELGTMETAPFQILRDYNTGVLFILKRQPFSSFSGN